MSLIHLVLMLMPWATSPELAAHFELASVRVNQGVAQAAQHIEEITPAWETALRTELADSPVYAGQLVAAIESAAGQTGIDPTLLWGVAYTETHGRHTNAAGKVKRGSHGEVGLMQIKPFWQRALKRVYGVDVDLYNIEDNVYSAALILARGGSEPAAMLSCYNTGKQIRSCPYQRKVMRYLANIGLTPAGLQEQAVAIAPPAQPAPPTQLVASTAPLTEALVQQAPARESERGADVSSASQDELPAVEASAGRRSYGRIWHTDVTQRRQEP